MVQKVSRSKSRSRKIQCLEKASTTSKVMLCPWSLCGRDGRVKQNKGCAFAYGGGREEKGKGWAFPSSLKLGFYTCLKRMCFNKTWLCFILAQPKIISMWKPRILFYLRQDFWNTKATLQAVPDDSMGLCLPLCHLSQYEHSMFTKWVAQFPALFLLIINCQWV